MDLSFTKEEMAFRDEVRAFFRDNVPPPTRQKLQEGRHLSKQEMIDWWRILNKKGWGVSHWPKEYGGTGWTSVQHYIFNEELQSYPAPAPLAFGVSMVGPVIYTFGNEKQKKEYLPRIANVDDWWCQGFSEPGSGSDLASLKTKAERKGDKWIINGQKTWTTLAQHAEPIILDPGFREKLAACEIELKALELTQLRVVADESKHGKGKPNPASSVLKIKGSEIQQTTTELLMEVIGPFALPYDVHGDDGSNEAMEWTAQIAPSYFNNRKVSIYGGSNEIQRNIIAKAVLGL